MSPFCSKPRSWLALASLSTLGCGLMIALAPTASAAGDTRYVATAADGGSDAGPNDCLAPSTPCATIQYAVFAASQGDTVSVAPGIYLENIAIERSITIQGQSPSTTTIDGSSVSNKAAVRVYHDSGHASPAVTIDGVTVTGAVSAPGIAVDGLDVAPAVTTLTVNNSVVDSNGGRGIEVFAGTALVSNSTVSNNGAEAGVYADGRAAGVTIDHSTIVDNDGSGVEVAAGSLAIDSSTITRNAEDGVTATASASGVTVSGSTLGDNGSSGIYVNAPPVTFRAPGHALLSPSVSGGSVRMPRPESTAPVCPAVTVNQSVLSGNGEYGATVYTGNLNVNFSTVRTNTSGGIFADSGSCVTTVVKSTLSGNGGPGIDAGGAGLDVTASTVADNTGTGIEVGAGVSTAIYQSTIAGNGGAGDPAGGLYYTGAGSVSVGATIIAGNSTMECAVSASPGVITDAGYNLSGDASCGFSSAVHSIANGDPKLGPLAGNGGSTQTMALGDGSDALDQIPGPSPLRAAGAAFARSIPADIGATCLTGLTSDQRNVARPQNGRCDIGAYESVAKTGGGSPAPTPTPTPTSAPTPAPTSAPAATTPRSTTTSTTAGVLGAGNTAAAPRTTTIAVEDLAQTGIGADRIASVGIVLLVIGVMLLVALARRESRSRH